jgi:hypothetical protein
MLVGNLFGKIVNQLDYLWCEMIAVGRHCCHRIVPEYVTTLSVQGFSY